MKRVTWRISMQAMCLMFVLLFVAPASYAAVVTLSNNNSTATIDPAGSMMTNWTVDGVDHLYSQTFYYRIGSTGGEAELSSLATPSVVVAENRILIATYVGGSFNVEIVYTLSGGTTGSNISDIAETINITNTSQSSLDLHFFQYNDFDLGGFASGDTAIASNANTIRQSDASTVFAEVIGTPAASHYQISTFPDLINALTDVSPTTLSDTPGIGVTAGPGDLTWAWEWDTTIAAGGSFMISKDKNLAPVPEPGTMMLLGSGLVGLAGWGRKKFRK